MLVKPSISFVTTDTDAKLVTSAETVVTSMTNNPNYATPAPTLAVVTAAINAFTVAIANAVNGGTEMTVIKNAKRAELVALLRQLALYVSAACSGDMVKLLSSGFPIQKPSRTPIGVLPPPVTPLVSLGEHSGELDAKTTGMDGAYSYGWRVALASSPKVYVQTEQTSAARVTFSGLTPGQTYLVEVNAVGAAGQSDWSNAAEMIVV